MHTAPEARTTERRGGARPGAGGKPAGYVKPQVAQDYDSAKARKEASLADMHELNFKIKNAEYVERAAVQEAAATMLAQLAQSIRSLPDELERKLHIGSEITEAIERHIDRVLGDASEALGLFTNERVE